MLMNLKETIKKIVSDGKSDPATLDLISKNKSDALKNNSLNLYSSLRDIEHSLYRYNSLTDAKLYDDAEKEGKKLMNLASNLDAEDVVLKGGISNIKYVWKTEPNACEKCQELDGTEYFSKDDIPEKPHPNCKCKVVEVREDDEECDCSKFFDSLEIIGENIEAAYNDTQVVDIFIKDCLAVFSTMPLINFANEITNQIDIAANAYHDFQKNKAEMIAYKGYDKYHHAKANCEATKRGLTGEMMAYTLSYGKEVYDLIKKVIFDGMAFETAWRDSMEDIRADKYGIQKGHEPDACSESVKNVGDIFNN